MSGPNGVSNGRRPSRTITRAPSLRYSPGVSRNSVQIALQQRDGRCYPSAAQRRRDASLGSLRKLRTSPSSDPEHGPPDVPGDRGTGSPDPGVLGRPYPSRPPQLTGINLSHGHSTSLARRTRRAPGGPLAGQLRDVAARHDARRCRGQPVPDRRPEWLRQGLARDALPAAHLADAGPDRGLQHGRGVRDGAHPGGRRTGRRVRPGTGTDGTGPRACRDRRRRPRRCASSRPGSAARAARPTSIPRYTFANFIVGLGQPARPRGLAVGRGAPRPRLQPALPVRRGGPRQDPPDARDRQPGDRQVPAQAGRLRDEREVHQRVHHEHPAGQDRRVPGALPADRPPPHRRHPVHRRQGADAGRVLPHVQRDPRGRQADRPELRPAAEADHHARGAPAQPVRVGPHRGPDGAGPRDADRDPAGQGRGGRGPDHLRRDGVHRPQGREQHPRARGRPQPDHRLRLDGRDADHDRAGPGRALERALQPQEAPDHARSGSPRRSPTTTASRSTRSRARSATRRSSCPARSRCS